MADKKQFSIGMLFLQIALGALLVVGGIWAFTGTGDFGCVALKEIFRGDALKILKIVFGVIELIVGVFLIIELFAGDVLGAFGKILKFIVIVMWIAAIVLADFLAGGGLLKSSNFLGALYSFASHLIVLGAMFCLI